MLSILSRHGDRDCGGLNRRDFLRVGSLGLGGLTLPGVLGQRAARGGASGGTAGGTGGSASWIKDKSIVFLFLCGGPSQIETFDPHMDSPAPHRSLTGSVRTSLPGVAFGATFPKLAKLAHKLAIVRSYAPHGIADHATAIRYVLRGGNPLKLNASIGAVQTRLRGGGHTPAGVPRFAELIADEVDSQYREDMERMRVGNAPGQLGAACQPFTPNGGGKLQDDMTLNLPLERLRDRRALHRSLDQLNRDADATGAMASLDLIDQQAMQMLLGGAARKALDLSQEDPRTVARYDTSDHVTGYLTPRRSTLGLRMLTARRLIEAGCRFVTVGMAGWDNHGNGNHPGVVEGMHLLGTPLDHVASTFLEDLEARGLSDDVLLVVTGEFGRTPRIQAKNGRDHWPGLCPLLFAGGGLNMGQVIGQSTRTADAPASEPIRLDNLVSTLMHAVFDVGQMRLDSSVPTDLMRMVGGTKPIEQLF